MSAAGFRPRREPGTRVATSAGPVFVGRRRAPHAKARPLVLVHGWLMAHGYYAAVVDALAGERELVLIDLPGHGESARPSPRQFAYDFAAFTGVLHEVLDTLALGEVDLMGHSMGGGVALRLSAERKDIVRLVLVAALAYPLPMPLQAQLLSVPVLGHALWHNLVRRGDFERSLGRDLEDPSLAGDAYVDWVYDHFQRAGGRAATYAAFAAATRFADTDFAHVQQRALVVWGEGDRLVPLAHGRRLAAELPRAQLEIIPAARHTPFVERPALFMSHLKSFLGASA
jgi:pimeloyl-ACP methyl ester carboxylesterase